MPTLKKSYLTNISKKVLLSKGWETPILKMNFGARLQHTHTCAIPIPSLWHSQKQEEEGEKGE